MCIPSAMLWSKFAATIKLCSDGYRNTDTSIKNGACAREVFWITMWAYARVFSLALSKMIHLDLLNWTNVSMWVHRVLCTVAALRNPSGRYGRERGKKRKKKNIAFPCRKSNCGSLVVIPSPSQSTNWAIPVPTATSYSCDKPTCDALPLG